MSQMSSRGTGGGGSGIIQTIAGDTGSITGANVTIFANNATENSGATVRFVNSGTTSTLNVTDTSFNTFIGRTCGNSTLTGSLNVGLGASLNVLTTGVENTAIGASLLSSLQAGSDNVAVGNGANNLVNGSNNVLIGNTLITNLVNGSRNVVIGFESGVGLTTNDSNNIIILNSGLAGDNNTIRIGDTQTKNFQRGITGVTVAASAPVAVASTGQLSSLGFGTAGQVLTSNGAATSPTWQAAGGGTNTTFSAYMSADAVDVTGDNTDYTIICDVAIVNQGSNYNTTTGEFTAPNTANYNFSFNALAESAGNFNSSNWFLKVNGSSANQFFAGSLPSTNSFSSIYASSVLSLNAGDVVTWTFSANSTAGKDVNIFGTQTLIRFSGFQIS